MTSGRDDAQPDGHPTLSHTLILAGLGAADTVRAAGAGLLNRLIALGRDRERRDRARVERRRYEAARALTRVSQTLVKVADVAATSVLGSLEIPTRRDVQALESQIHRIAERLEGMAPEDER